MDIPRGLLKVLKRSKRVVVLTGAGISKESGIPTFREAQTGLWEKYDPMELASPQAFLRNSNLVWEWYRWRRDIITKAEPNPGHYALVEFEAKYPYYDLITQNIDGFHHRAGSKKVIELHGNIFRYKCFYEEVVIENVEDLSDGIPRCTNCGGYLRPDVVWFGESLPNDSLSPAMKVSQNAEIFLSVGTSALIQPAPSLPIIALNNGAVVVEINPAETPIPDHAQFSLHGPSGEILPRLVDHI